ncbi:hypothetical protein H0X10_04625 [Candidatus Saccharibacteria bacterium]|nr:hypothetical protein [Candidatus Saccharibacteria bacterium]
MNQTTTSKETTCLNCGQLAHLYTSGKYQGIWECTNHHCGASDEHDHQNIVTKIVEGEWLNRGEYEPYNATVTSCADCKVEIEGDY